MCPYSTLFLFPYTRVCKRTHMYLKQKLKKGPRCSITCAYILFCVCIMSERSINSTCVHLSCHVTLKYVYGVSCIVYLVSCIVYLVSCILYRISCIVYRVSCIVYLVSCIVYRVTCIDRRNCPQFHVMGFIFNVVLLF